MISDRRKRAYKLKSLGHALIEEIAAKGYERNAAYDYIAQKTGKYRSNVHFSKHNNPLVLKQMVVALQEFKAQIDSHEANTGKD